MNERPVVALLGILAIGLLGFLVFPGHTYLQQDSQIYLPMMERIADARVLGNDLIAMHPHLSFTLYDEIAILLHKLFGFDFQIVLAAQQLITRLLGLLGIFLLARSTKISYAGALFVTGLFGLGATIVGPSVLTIEYEPTPRAFALLLIVFAAGLAAIGTWRGAGLVSFLSFLYHPPTVLPVLGLLAVYKLLPWNEEERKDRRRYFAWLAAAVLVLIAAATLQSGVRLQQQVFSVISPDVEQLQRMRASYVWVGMWFSQFGLHHILVFLVSAGAWWRASGHMPPVTRWLLGALPVAGLFSLLVSFVLLDVLKWGLGPQLQPARAVLWTTFSLIVCCALAAVVAEKWSEKALWLVPPFAIVVLTRPLSSTNWQQWAFVLLFAATGALVLRFDRQWMAGAFAIAVIFAIPYGAGVRNYPALHTPDLDGLSAWARAHTPFDAMFHFEGAGRDLAPGIFRARALRSVWVDWKGGGQVNFMEDLAREWWRRWQQQQPPPGAYVVHRAKACPNALYANSTYCVSQPR